MLRVPEVSDVGIQGIGGTIALPCDIDGCNHNCAYRVVDNTGRETPDTWTRLLCEEHTKLEYP